MADICDLAQKMGYYMSYYGQKLWKNCQLNSNLWRNALS